MAFKQLADSCQYVQVKNGVASILQEMLQESPRDGASDVSSYWPGHTPASAIINHNMTGKGLIANLANVTQLEFDSIGRHHDDISITLRD